MVFSVYKKRLLGILFSGGIKIKVEIKIEFKLEIDWLRVMVLSELGIVGLFFVDLGVDWNNFYVF